MTGVGCLLEFEVVVNSGSVTGSIRQPYEQPQGVPSQVAENVKRVNARLKFETWAYGDETGQNPLAPSVAVNEVANG